MPTRSSLAVVAAVVLSLALGGAPSLVLAIGEETRITSQPAGQWTPDISGQWIVWHDQRNDEGDIYLYRLDTREETRLTTNAAKQYEPKVSGTWAVWSDYRDATAGWEVAVYGQQLPVGEQQCLSTGVGTKFMPDVDGTQLVWAGHDTGDFPHFNVFTRALPSGASSTVVGALQDQYSPSVSGSRVVWFDCRNLTVSGGDIYMKDLGTGSESVVCQAPGEQRSPSVAGSRVVWQDNRTGEDYDIYYRDMAGGTEVALTVGGGNQYDPRISGDLVAWWGESGESLGNWDVYVHNLRTNMTYRLTTDASSQSRPALDGYRVVWEDSRHGNSEIYLSCLPDALLVSADLPSEMGAGATAEVTLRFQNIGATTWTHEKGYAVGLKGAPGVWSPTLIEMAAGDSVAPGETWTVSFVLQAPGSEGAFACDWQMRQGQEWFGDTAASEVTVRAPAPDAVLLSSDVPYDMKRASSSTATFLWQNAGDTTWTYAGGYALACKVDATAWMPTLVDLGPSDEIGPGEEWLVQFSVSAPSVAGEYACDWQMTLSGVWFGELAEHDVRVFTFDDVRGFYWSWGEVEAAHASGVVAGYPDGLYHPEAAVTRSQMAVYMARALAGGDAAIPDPGCDTPPFPDVGCDYWARKYIQYALAEGVVQGYEDGYHPEEMVNRGQMAVYIARALCGGEAGVPDPGCVDPVFPDVPCDFWARKHVQYIRYEDVTGGYPDGLYHPEYTVTRDQMAVYVARAFDLGM